MTTEIGFRDDEAIAPPVGVILEVQYAGGAIGTAIWTGRSWRPRYQAIAPVAWRRRYVSIADRNAAWTRCPKTLAEVDCCT